MRRKRKMQLQSADKKNSSNRVNIKYESQKIRIKRLRITIIWGVSQFPSPLQRFSEILRKNIVNLPQMIEVEVSDDHYECRILGN